MENNCNTVVFSNRAYNAIIRESFKKNPVETGGILLGHIINDVWVVMEVLPPGKHSIFEVAYFEYDKDFVNYLADSVANQYAYPLELLGLWHRHPGSMDYFSSTDDVTNTTFALQNEKGVISGLVNIDPRFRLTMYHLDYPNKEILGRPSYNKVEVVVGDDVIPNDFFELKFIHSADSDIHPIPSDTKEFLKRKVAEREYLPLPVRNTSEKQSDKVKEPSHLKNKDDQERKTSNKLPSLFNMKIILFLEIVLTCIACIANLCCLLLAYLRH